MYLVRFDKVTKIPYNENEERFITWLRLINSKNLNEMQRYIRKDDKIMTETQKFVAEWNAKSGEGGFAKYVEQRTSEAKEEGISQGIIQTATKMIKKNIPINTIAEVTGLSLKEIKALKN